jgi:hypothetical protein
MPSINIRKRFAPGILASIDKGYAKRTGIKPTVAIIRINRSLRMANDLDNVIIEDFPTGSIRAKERKAIKKGNTLRFFTGYRTKKVRFLGKVACLKTEKVVFLETAPGIFSLELDSIGLNDIEIQKIAVESGFVSSKAMFDWLPKTLGFPITGVRIHLANSYNRKYYLHKRTKELGVRIQLTKCGRTIEVETDQVDTVLKSKHVSELANKHSYGIQVINPLFK